MTGLRNLKLWRHVNDKRQVDVADALGVSPRTVGNWETGRTEPSMGDLVELARLTGMTVGQVAGSETYRPEVDHA